MKLTEISVQDRIYNRFSQGSNLMIVPCSSVFGWEADMVVVTRALITHELEIKLTRQDFLKDKKKDKFEHIQMWMDGKRKYEKTFFEKTSPSWKWEMNVLQPSNYFWYVCPPGLITPDEVPSWAGIMYVDQLYPWNPVKKPVKLHKEKLTSKQVFQLASSMNFRYWMKRLGR